MPELTDTTEQHQETVADYMDEHRDRLRKKGNYLAGPFRSLDAYTHSKEHRKLRKVCFTKTDGQWLPWKDVNAAFRAELILTIGTRYELWSWTLYAEACWVRDDMRNHTNAVMSGVRCSSQGNSPDDILGEWICDPAIDDALDHAGVS